MKSRGGFTLVEILLVIFVIALISTAAISNYISSTGTFNFLSKYKQIMSVIRTARSFALTNKEVANPKAGEAAILPERYGVYISGKEVFLFADVGDKAMFYDKNEDDIDAAGQSTNCNNVSTGGDDKYDVIIADKCFNFGESEYLIKAADSNNGALGLPVVLFYKTGTADLEIRQNASDQAENEVVAGADHKCISFELSQIDDDLKKYIVVFQVSGLAEEYDTLTVCQ